VNEPDNLEFVISFNPDFQEQTIQAGELRLIKSFLPEILKEIAIQSETNKE
jgi:hypothetical protein